MAEGGFLPWKLKADDGVKYADYSKLREPLPNPPKGYHWIQAKAGDDDNTDGKGNWGLKDEATGEIVSSVPVPDAFEKAVSISSNLVVVQVVDGKRAAAGNQAAVAATVEVAKGEPVELAEYLDHVIMPEDTLQGLCLRYKVKAQQLRRVNGFLGDAMRTCKVLKIPTAHLCATGASFVPQSRTRDVAVQEFRNATNLGAVEAKLYLEDHSWDAAKALAAWQDDNAWEDKVVGAATAAKEAAAAKEAEAEADASGTEAKGFRGAAGGGGRNADVELSPFPPARPVAAVVASPVARAALATKAPPGQETMVI